MRGERVSGPEEQLDEFYSLWNDYWGQKITPDPRAHRRLRRWRTLMALFEQSWQLYQLALTEAHLKKTI